MKAFKIATLALSLILSATISMANNKGTKSGKINPDDKTGITQQEIFDNVNKSFDEAGEVVIMEAFNNPVGSIPIDTRNSIYDVLTYPKFAQDGQRYDAAVVSFTYTEDGFLKILTLSSSDEELNAYILSKLENIRLKDGTVTIGKAYYARIQFYLINSLFL